jgi:hypothetical protein
MATVDRSRRAAQFEALKAEFERRITTPISEEEKARRREMTRRLRDLRDSGPSIAPDTTSQYIEEIRREMDERAGFNS